MPFECASSEQAGAAGLRLDPGASRRGAVRRHVTLGLVAISLAWSHGLAVAGGLAITTGAPRAVGRAGTSSVSDDGGGGLIANPAAIARRDGLRAQIGMSFVDDELAWRANVDGAPMSRSQAASRAAPYVAGFASWGAWVGGFAVMTSTVSERALRPPIDIRDPQQLGSAFEYRYLGIAGSVRKDTATLGVARRIGDSVALGISFAGSRVALRETRRLWAGFSGRDRIGDPARDIELELSGTDRFVPGVVAGLLVAPIETSFELGASVAWTAAARVSGTMLDYATWDEGPTVAGTAAPAKLVLRSPVMARLSARYLAETMVLEVGAEISVVSAEAETTTWAVEQANVVDSTGASASLTRVPSRISMQTHGTVRGSIDRELVAGFLWATAGYAYATASTSLARQSPSFGDLGGHTLALGVEAIAGGFTVTLGWSRTWSVAQAQATTAFSLDNPFAAGDGPAGTGTYDGSIDQIGILIDAELVTPE